MNIVIPTGEVGSDPLIKIRGQIGSVNGGSSPLILLDNVEIPSIQLVNPNDIQSITVLKDAASASIYGSKAAFGVVLITTKNGTRGPKLQCHIQTTSHGRTLPRKSTSEGSRLLNIPTTPS